MWERTTNKWINDAGANNVAAMNIRRQRSPRGATRSSASSARAPPQPCLRARPPRPAAAGVYRSLAFGDGVRVLLLDTRSFRDAHLTPSCGAWLHGVPLLRTAHAVAAAFTRLAAPPGGVAAVASGRRREAAVVRRRDRSWAWLDVQGFADAARAGARFVVVVSSVQFATTNQAFELALVPARARDAPTTPARASTRRAATPCSRATCTTPRSSVTDQRPREAAHANCGELVEVTSSGLTHTIATSAVGLLLLPFFFCSAGSRAIARRATRTRPSRTSGCWNSAGPTTTRPARPSSPSSRSRCAADSAARCCSARSAPLVRVQRELARPGGGGSRAPGPDR